MKEFITISEKQLLYAALNDILNKREQEKKRNYNNTFSHVNWITVYDAQAHEINQRIIEIEKQEGETKGL